MIPHKLWLYWSSGFRGKFEHTHIHRHIDTFSRKPSVLNIFTCPYILVYQTQHLRVVPDKIEWGMAEFIHTCVFNICKLNKAHKSINISLTVSYPIIQLVIIFLYVLQLV